MSKRIKIDKPTRELLQRTRRMFPDARIEYVERGSLVDGSTEREPRVVIPGNKSKEKGEGKK